MPPVEIQRVVRRKSGIILDVASGPEPQEGAVGMDARPHPKVDIVHDYRELPWPLDDETVLTIIAAHVVEHINPADDGFVKWMNEAWRVLKPRGQLAIVTPYAGSPIWWMDPTNCNGCTERTFLYFDPESDAGVYGFYEPAPWSLEVNLAVPAGNMEVVLRKRPDKPAYHADGDLHYGRVIR